VVQAAVFCGSTNILSAEGCSCVADEWIGFNVPPDTVGHFRDGRSRKVYAWCRSIRFLHVFAVSLWPHIYSASSWSQHTLFALCHSDQTIFITQSHSPLLPTCFTSSLEPTSHTTQNSSSKLFILLSATFIWTCQFNLLHTLLLHSITFSLFHSELKIYFF